MDCSLRTTNNNCPLVVWLRSIYYISFVSFWNILLVMSMQCYLPFQSIYITAMDREIDNSNSAQTTTSLLTGHKFLEVRPFSFPNS